jgi:UDP-GlcNAc:undecaprenyl-phosphate GlcNAc-1-phosphate transferase
MLWGVLVTVLLTVVTTVVLSKVGPVDQPRERGLSQWATATSGGLGVIAGVMTGLMVFVSVVLPPPGPGLAVWLLLGACVVGFLGALDDVFDIPPLPKLAVQIAAALAFSIFVARVEVLPVGPGLDLTVGPILGVIGTALWIIVMINAYNFMDGSDGLAWASSPSACSPLHWSIQIDRSWPLPCWQPRSRTWSFCPTTTPASAFSRATAACCFPAS